MLKLKCSSLFRACGVGGEFSGGADLEVSTLEKFAAALPAQKILSFHQRPAQAQPPCSRCERAKPRPNARNGFAFLRSWNEKNDL